MFFLKRTLKTRLNIFKTLKNNKNKIINQIKNKTIGHEINQASTSYLFPREQNVFSKTQ